MAFDRRLTPARPDLAAAHLRGRVDAGRFVEGARRRVAVPVAPVRAEPRADCPLDTEALLGETVTVYDISDEGWAWGQLDRDGYVGWLPSEALAEPGPDPTHRIAAIRSLVFPGPELKLPVVRHLSQGSLVTVTRTIEKRGLDYAVLADGTATVARHLEPLAAPPVRDFVAAAEAYLGSPYVWGGRSAFGIDCSGLVQMALERAGIAAPRDTDMQEGAVGAAVAFDGDLEALRRGDLVFWKGHVGIVADDGLLLHATGFYMATVFEPLVEAISRIAAAGWPVTTVRRL